MIFIEYIYSINGKKYEAKTTRKTIHFNLNLLNDYHDLKLNINPLDKIFDFDTWLESFLNYTNAIEFHELGYIFNPKIGCDNHTENDGGNLCLWCREVEKIYNHLHSTDKQ